MPSTSGGDRGDAGDAAAGLGVDGIGTQTSIGKLLIAGGVPGLIVAAFLIIAIIAQSEERRRIGRLALDEKARRRRRGA